MPLADQLETQQSSERPPRIVITFILLFWLAQFSLLTMQRFATEMDEPTLVLVPRALVALVAVGFSLGIAWVQMHARFLSLHYRIAIALLLAVAGSICHTIANTCIFLLLVPEMITSQLTWVDWAMPLFQLIWSYIALSGMIYALLANAEMRERESKFNALERVANDAQMRALRYQLNPHFMFNTLNSVAALISGKRAADAELMVENLADFLRASLSLDPLAELPLAREIELQSLYLDIEKVRFADRLRVRTDIDAAAMEMLVPALVTQPLIENAIRHAVHARGELTEIAIDARVQGGELHFSVTNDVPHNESARGGTGVGLANVENRLRLRFGDRVRFSAGRLSGRYRVAFVIPATRATPA
ncbi:MAG: hypothetical protein EOP58_00585 [Sphingomonadales bacterium]|nr:MAG: hypothetical protein EOP58_00585 [Sphingomonadales bacterium]